MSHHRFHREAHYAVFLRFVVVAFLTALRQGSHLT